MRCEKLNSIKPYFNGELGNHESDFIKNHLESCSECSEYLEELRYHDQILSPLKSYKPEIADPVSFRNEILENIEQKKIWSLVQELSKVLDYIVFILVQPVTRYSFITAAIVIFGVFVYQQSIIVQKIGSLEKRMETKINTEDSKIPNRKSVEALFKKRPDKKSEDKEFNELLDEYRLLQIKHRVLLKTLKKKYPEVYQDILNGLEEAELLPENFTI